MLLWSTIQESPLWIWPLLALMILIGLRARQTRSVPVIIYYLIPVIGLMTLGNVMPLPNPFLVWSVFPLAYFTGVLLGYRWQRDYLISREGNLVTLKGEGFTLISVVILFGLSFFTTSVSVNAPDLYSHAGFIILFCLSGGQVSGSFAGRAIRIWTG